MFLCKPSKLCKLLMSKCVNRVWTKFTIDLHSVYTVYTGFTQSLQQKQSFFLGGGSGSETCKLFVNFEQTLSKLVKLKPSKQLFLH